MFKELKHLRQKQHEEWKNTEIELDNIKPETLSTKYTTIIKTPHTFMSEYYFDKTFQESFSRSDERYKKYDQIFEDNKKN